MKWFESLINKIELQSLVISVIVFGGGLYLVNNTFVYAYIAGLVLLGSGLLYSFISFFTLNSRECYKDIIKEQRDTIESRNKTITDLNAIISEDIRVPQKMVEVEKTYEKS